VSHLLILLKNPALLIYLLDNSSAARFNRRP